MPATRREFLRNTLGLAVASQLPIHLHGAAAQQQPPAPYGSGNFGLWTTDEFNLPAYRYTANQITDPHAVTDLQPGILSPTEHIHQVGNDRIIALASNYGHVRVRQDEGCPKFLNDYDPDFSQFSGGLGYLTDGNQTLSTYYDATNPSFERIFGIGYFRKKIASSHYAIDQVIHAPFGDDPVLLSQVTITNQSATAATLRWVEYWGTQPFQFSFRSALESTFGKRTQTEIRREMARRFQHHVTKTAGNRGLLDSKTFPGRTPEEEAAWAHAKAILKASPLGFDAPVHDLQPGTDFESLDIPQTFLVSLDGSPTGVSSNAASFFGSGGPANPTGLKQPLGDNLAATPHTGLLIERTLHLAPGQSQTLSFLYGYLTQGFTLPALITKYERSRDTSLRTTTAAWKQNGMRFDVPSQPWIKREATWNHYYLRSSLTYDDFFQEHLLNQNGFYQYVMGFQGAPRDPLQHSLPFLFSNPEIVKSVLRYTLKEVRDDGSIPYGIVGHGVVAPMQSDNASDLPLWLLWAVSEYILATRDLDFLHEQIPSLLSSQPNRTATVSQLLERCYRHQVKDVGTGQHGIMRMLVDDWNDGLIYTWAYASMQECIDQSESVLNSAMAAWVFDEYARLLDYAGNHSPLIQEARASAKQHREATSAQWNGKWFRRAWLGPKAGWLGESTLWIEPQPWAILSGATTPDQTRSLIGTMNDLLRKGPLGAAQMSQGPDMRTSAGNGAGTLEMGAIWPSLNQTLVWALAATDPAMAWQEWKRNTLAVHAESYPNIWYGIWSGNDSWNSPIAKHPGGAADEQYFRGTDFPVLNLHAHACMLYSSSKLLGIEFTPAGMKLNLNLPEATYRFDSSLVGVVKSASRYEGWYMPSRAGNWTIEITLPAESAQTIKRSEINGNPSPIKKQPGGTIHLSGASSPGKPLRWTLS